MIEKRDALRCIDAKIAQQIFNMEVFEGLVLEDGHPVGFYTTNILCTWEVLKKFKDYNCSMFFSANLKKWFCQIGQAKATAETAPLAVCRAALEMGSGKC